jgi:hypothetical protein
LQQLKNEPKENNVTEFFSPLLPSLLLLSQLSMRELRVATGFILSVFVVATYGREELCMLK